MKTHAARGPLEGGLGPLCKTYTMGEMLTDDFATVDCARCRALLMEPGPIVAAPTTIGTVAFVMGSVQDIVAIQPAP